MLIHTTRFGEIKIDKEDVFHFSEGLLGFTELRKFVLLDDSSEDVFAWLQSCENAGISFPILEPELFIENYSVSLAKSDMSDLQISDLNECHVFSIITIPSNPKEMTANLKAPIIINVKLKQAKQCVLQDNKYVIKEPIFSKLQQRVVQNPQSAIKSKAFDWGVAIKLPEVGAEILSEVRPIDKI